MCALCRTRKYLKEQQIGTKHFLQMLYILCRRALEMTVIQSSSQSYKAYFFHDAYNKLPNACVQSRELIDYYAHNIEAVCANNKAYFK